MTQLQNVSNCTMESHSVTCYLTQVNAPHIHPNQPACTRPFKRRQGANSNWPTVATRPHAASETRTPTSIAIVSQVC